MKKAITLTVKKCLLAVLPLILALVAAVIALGYNNSMPASALGPGSRRIQAQSYIIHNNTLCVQYDLRNYSGGDSGTYKLLYSSNAASFPSGANAGPSGVDYTTVDITDKSAKYGIIRVDLGNVDVGDKWYFAFSSVESSTGGLTGITSTRYDGPYEVTAEEYDGEQAYFMDCGSVTAFGFEASSTDACLTPYQSVTWQKFGADPVTGKQWGVTTAVNAAVDTSQSGILNSTLVSSVEKMKFKFEVESSVEYNVVMGFKDNSDSTLNSAGDVYVNGAEEITGSYVGGFNSSVIAFENPVQGVSDGADKYFLEIEVRKADISSDMPMCSFISIRKADAVKERFITAGYVEYQVESGTKADELPEKLTVYTTAGEEELDVAYTMLSDDGLTLNGNSSFYLRDDDLGNSRPMAVVEYGEKEYTFPIIVSVWTDRDMFYFVDCQQFLPFSPGTQRHEYLKDRYSDTFLSTDALDKQSYGSDDWGWFGAKPKAYWGNTSPYHSLNEGNSIKYNFPGLPAGSYTFEYGVYEPWGGSREMTVWINGVQFGGIFQTANRSQSHVDFIQQEDGAPIYIEIRGGAALVGWMLISGEKAENIPATATKEELQAVYDEYDGIKDTLTEGEYTAGSWADFETALEDALLVLDDTNATLEDMGAALKAIKTAYLALAKPVNKENLENVCEEYAECNEAEYTAASWAKFETALENALAVLDDENAIQNEVDNALQTLKNAYGALVKKPDGAGAAGKTITKHTNLILTIVLPVVILLAGAAGCWFILKYGKQRSKI